jgi:hypothetical protein
MNKVLQERIFLIFVAVLVSEVTYNFFGFDGLVALFLIMWMLYGTFCHNLTEHH